MYSTQDILDLLPDGYTLENSKQTARTKNSPFIVRCSEGHIWSRCTITKLMDETGCSTCNRKDFFRKITLSEDEFKSKLAELGYELKSPYFAMNKRVTVQCLTCGKTNTRLPYNIKETCEVCTYTAKRDAADEEILKNLELNGITLIKRVGDLFKLKCLEYNHIYEVSRKSLKRKSYCSVCASNSALTIEEIRKRAVGYEVTGSYINEGSILRFTHLKCGNSFDRSWNVFQRGLICPVCNIHKKLSYNEVKNILESYNLQWIANEYMNIDSTLILKCNVPHHEPFESTLRRLSWSVYYHCPRCKIKHRSSQEEIIAQKIEEKGFKVDRNDRSLGKEIDVYIPQRAIGIEYCGHAFHNHTRRLPSHHIDKQEYLKQKGCNVAFIFDDHWKFNRDGIFAWINNILEIKPIYTTFCNIPYSEGLKFYNANSCDQLAGNKPFLFYGGYVKEILKGILVFEYKDFKATLIRHINLDKNFLEFSLKALADNGFIDIKARLRCQLLEHIALEELGYKGNNVSIEEFIVKAFKRQIYKGGDVPYGWYRLTGCRVKEFNLMEYSC